MIKLLFPDSLKTPISVVESRFTFTKSETEDKLQRFFLNPFPKYKEKFAAWLFPLTNYDTEKCPKTGDGLTISDLLEKSVSNSQPSMISLIGPPGVGKTASLIYEATKRFIIFITAAEGESAMEDPSWVTFKSQLVSRENALQTAYNATRKSPSDWLEYQRNLRQNAVKYCCLYFVARILFFLWLKKLVPTLNEKQFFIAQLNGPSEHLGRAFSSLLNDENLDKAEGMLENLRLWLSEKKIVLTIAIDEAQILSQLANNCYLSLAAISKAVADNGQISTYYDKTTFPKQSYARGLLSVLVNIVSGRFSLIISGTKLSLGNTDVLESNLVKDSHHFRVHRFPYLNDCQVWSRLQSFLDLNNCHPNPEDLHYITGRLRWTDTIISELFNSIPDSGTTKQEHLSMQSVPHD